MAASEVAVSLALFRLYDLLSKSKDIIISRKLTDQISASLDKFQRILDTRKDAELNDDHNQETRGGEIQLLDWAGRADKIAEDLVASFRAQMKKMAKDFRMKVGFLFSEFTSAQPPGKGLLENERASSSSLSKRNRENMRQRVESNIVGHDKCVEDLVAWLINDGDSNRRVISVVGKHACGKTALVRSVFSKLKIKHHFDCLAWVRVPDLGVESDWIQNLLVNILKQTPLQDQAKDLENKQEEQQLETLHKLLMDLRYLIVVDDLGEASLINKLLVQFVDSMNGSRWKLDGSARSCRMPAFLHEFFFRKAKELGLLQIQYSSDSVSEKESRGAEQSAQNQQKQGQNTATGHCGYQVRCLQSFASFDTRKLGTQARKLEDPLKSPILEGRLGLLRVLDLEGVFKPVLPENFGNTLSNIRYLGLRWTVLDSIPESVGNLLLLETLDLKHTNITKVTSAIWNAKNLQHLFLSEASFDKLRSRDLLGQPGNLNLSVTKNSDFHWPTSLSKLYLIGSLTSVPPLPVSPGNLKALTLSMSELKDDPMSSLHCLKDLIVLRLLAQSCTSTTLRCGEGSFPKLRVLRLWMLENLKKLDVRKGAMPNREGLDIRHVSLTRVPEVLDPNHSTGVKVFKGTLVKAKELVSKVKVYYYYYVIFIVTING
ncbi:hypothetical protein BT93_A0483 [Corymbia citriodora subsp. variegata]|nr:hypothetical protein BT93_A0483 [Corymbia citriodora subsp. variegata]